MINRCTLITHRFNYSPHLPAISAHGSALRTRSRFGVVVATCFVHCILHFIVPALHEGLLYFASGFSPALITCPLPPVLSVHYMSLLPHTHMVSVVVLSNETLNPKPLLTYSKAVYRTECPHCRTAKKGASTGEGSLSVNLGAVGSF